MCVLLTLSFHDPRRCGIDADNDSDDEGPGLFESDGEDEPQKKASKPLSKRERMEALRAKKRQDTASNAPPKPSSKKRGAEKSGDIKEAGYESEESYDSAEYVRTKEDFDFIDTEGDDQDAINELYAEQTFDDAEADEDGYSSKKKKIKGAGSSRERSERQDLGGDADDDNPIMMAVNKMKRKKKVQKKLSDLQDEAKEFLTKMQQAAEEDEEAFQQRRPAIKKLSMLTEVCVSDGFSLCPVESWATLRCVNACCSQLRS